MRLIVVADTHMPRRGTSLPAFLTEGIEKTRPDLILHLGDFTGEQIPELFERFAPLQAVAGNNDGTSLHARFGRRKIVEVGGVRIGMVHGDSPRGTAVETALRSFAADNLDVIAFGHSHLALCERRDDFWLLNPGSPTDRRRSPYFSYAELEIAGRRITPKLHCHKPA